MKRMVQAKCSYALSMAKDAPFRLPVCFSWSVLLGLPGFIALWDVSPERADARARRVTEFDLRRSHG